MTDQTPQQTPSLTDDVIEGAKFALFEVFVANFDKGGFTIKGKTFRDCLIQGPAVMLPIDGCNFDACNFGEARGDMRNIILRPAAPAHVTGAIAMSGCSFIRCQFVGIGFTGANDFLDQLAKVRTGPAQ